MRYRVFWSPYAEARLDTLLEDIATRELVATTANQIDSALAIDPIEFGESRYDTVRIGFIRPLAVQYDLLHDVATVIVDDVWRIDAPRST